LKEEVIQMLRDAAVRLFAELLVGFVVFSIIRFGIEHFGRIFGLLGHDKIVLLFIISAILLFIMRVYIRAAYGMVEIYFALAAIFSAADDAATIPAQVAFQDRIGWTVKAASGVYFFIRGLVR
jgi:hypothetical protein